MAEPSALTDEQQESLLRQLEFYFCDMSFPFDDFLKGQAAEDGSIPASVIASSPRIVTLAPGLDAAAREALLLSLAARSDSVVVAASGAHFKRRYPLPAEDPAAAHSVYIAGMPKDADEAKVTAMLTEAKQAHTYVPIVAVRRLRDLQKSRAFTGHVFVQLEDATKAAALAKACSHGAVDCKKAKLLADFFSSQASAILEQRAKRAAAGGPSKPGGPAAESATHAKRPREEVAEAEVERGCVLAFDGVGAEASRDAIKELCAKHGGEGSVAFVEHYPGNASGYVRFAAAAGATLALAALATSTEEVGGAVPSWRLLPEEEEVAYREKTKKQKKGDKGGKGKGKGKGGKGKGGKRE